MKNRLISKIIFAGLLLGTLPMSVPAQAQTIKSISRAELKMEVDREVAKIQKTVKRLRAAKIIVPTIIAGAGVALTAVVAAVAVAAASMFFSAPKSKIKKVWNDIRKMQEKKKKNRLILYNYLKKQFKSSPRLLNKSLAQFSPDKKFIKIAEDILHNVFNPEVARINRIANSRAVIGVIIVALFGLFSTAAASLSALFGLSAASVAAAFSAAKRIEHIKKKYPTIVTSEQEKVLTQLKKLSKNMITRAIIKNVRLNEALQMVVGDAMRQHVSLVASLGGQKKAEKIVRKYIKLKWQEHMLTKILATGTRAVKSLVIKLRLKWVKRRLARVERRYPQLKRALKNAVQTYIKQANRILEELKDQILNVGSRPQAFASVSMPISTEQIVPL